MFARLGWAGFCVALVGLILMGSVLWLRTIRITEEKVRHLVVTTVQREAPESFFVTGTIDLATTVSARSYKRLFPDVINLDLGTTESTVRIPGRISYGFDIRTLKAEDIYLFPDGIVEVRLPELAIYSIEPNLAEMEIETSVGWARLQARSGRETERAALQQVRDGMQAQGMQHLHNSSQPGIHTAMALQHLLRPVLEASGLRNPRFRFYIGEDLVMEPSAE